MTLLNEDGAKAELIRIEPAAAFLITAMTAPNSRSC